MNWNPLRRRLDDVTPSPDAARAQEVAAHDLAKTRAQTAGYAALGRSLRWVRVENDIAAKIRRAVSEGR